MNKNTLYNIFLIGCPAAAIAIASGSKSVAIIDRATKETTYQSYFDLLPENAFAISTVLAMGLAIFALIFAIVYVVSKDAAKLKMIYLLTFAAVFAAEIPALMQNELLIMPSPFAAILLVQLDDAAAHRHRDDGARAQLDALLHDQLHLVCLGQALVEGDAQFGLGGG